MGTSDQDITAQHTLQSHAPQAQSASSKRRSEHQPRRRRWIRVIGVALSIVLLLALIGGGSAGYFAYRQYPALNTLNTRFCRDLSQQNYGDAYQLLSKRLQSQISAPNFFSLGNDLDSIEGSVEFCSAQSQEMPQIGVFPLYLTVPAAITRTTTYHGTIRVVYENGQWKIDALSASLLGANLSALSVAEQFCYDSSDADYLAIWSLYGQKLQSVDASNKVKAATAALPPVNPASATAGACVTSLGPHNSDTSAHITMGQVSADLSIENGTWKITAISSDPVAMLIRVNAPASQQELDRQYAIISNEVAQIQQGPSAPDWYAFTHNPVYVYINPQSRGPEQTPGGVLDQGNGGGREIAAGFVGAFTNASNQLYVVLLVQGSHTRSSVPGAFLNNPQFLILRWQSQSNSGIASFSLSHTTSDLVGHRGGASGGAIEELNPLASSANDGNAVQVAQAANNFLIGEWVGVSVGLQKNDPTTYALADYLSGANVAPPERLMSVQEILPAVHGIMHGDAAATAAVKLSVDYLGFIATNYKSRS